MSTDQKIQDERTHREDALMRLHAAFAEAEQLSSRIWAHFAFGRAREDAQVVYEARERLLEGMARLESRLRPGAKFPLGRVTTTAGAAEVLGGGDGPVAAEACRSLLDRHLAGDWGDMDAEDKETNERALAEGGRLMSAYFHDGQKLWVITEADRSATTILTPNEY